MGGNPGERWEDGEPVGGLWSATTPAGVGEEDEDEEEEEE